MHQTANAPTGRSAIVSRRAFAQAGLGLTALACLSPLTALADASASEDVSSATSAREVVIELSDSGVLVDGTAVGEDASAAVYLAHDVVYYEDRDTYDSGNPYGEGDASERHSAQDAQAVTVVHIARAGTYRLSGTLSAGQIAVDLGEDAADNPAAVVTLVLDGIDVTCSVAPAVIFYNVYECDGSWSTDTASSQVDTSAAGANVVLADGSANRVSGSHVARIYKDNTEQKKLWKLDGAFYSCMSLNVDGEAQGTGSLTIEADNEGLDSELHLTINGGNLSIFAQDDGINTNEDGVSVCCINGGSVHILGGLGSEGDGIDSNGWLVINGGTVVAMANPASDSGLDADMGSYVNGGRVVALGSTMDWAESDSAQVTMNLQFSDSKDAGDAIVITDVDGSVVFAYDPSEDEVAGAQVRTYRGAVVSCPELAVGETYHVFVGGAVSGEETGGMYDPATVISHEGGEQQAYTGTDVQGGPGGMGKPPAGDGTQPDGKPPADAGERPEGESSALPDGASGQPGGEPPAGVGPQPEGKPPAKPGGEGAAPGQDAADGVDASTEFYMQDKVNAFSGVAGA